MAWAGIFSSAPNKYINAFNAKTARDESQANRRLQRDALQKGIQWKVKDAEMAGIHPVFALGASTNMPAPINTDFGPSQALGDHFSQIGDRIARQRAQAQADALTKAQVQESQSRTALNMQEVSDRARAAQDPKYSPTSSGLTLPPRVPFQTSPTTKAQVIQDEYGDLVEALYGAGRLTYDAYLNLREAVGPLRNTQRKGAPVTPEGERAQSRGGRERVR